PCGRNRWTGQSATARRSARPRNDRRARRCTPPSFLSAVELRLGKIRRCRPQNVVRSLEFLVLAPQLLELLGLGTGQTRSLPLVSLNLANPAAQRLRGAAKLLRDR